MKERLALVLAVAEVGALVAFFYYAEIAKDIYFSIEEFNPGDDVVRYVEWNTSAREALLATVVLWLVAIALAIREYARARKSVSALVGYRLRPLTTFTLLIPAAGLVAAFVFGLFLPRD